MLTLTLSYKVISMAYEVLYSSPRQNRVYSINDIFPFQEHSCALHVINIKGKTILSYFPSSISFSRLVAGSLLGSAPSQGCQRRSSVES